MHSIRRRACAAAWQDRSLKACAKACKTTGVVLLLITLLLSYTGYLLPWDQLAFWAITVGTAIAGYAPIIGKDIQFLLMGGTSVGQEALLRFYVLHVAVLPAILTLMIAIHFWRIRKDGGISGPL